MFQKSFLIVSYIYFLFLLWLSYLKTTVIHTLDILSLSSLLSRKFIFFSLFFILNLFSHLSFRSFYSLACTPLLSCYFGLAFIFETILFLILHWVLSCHFWVFLTQIRTSFFQVSFCCSVTQSCPTLCDPMNYSTQGFPVLRYLLELA